MFGHLEVRESMKGRMSMQVDDLEKSRGGQHFMTTVPNQMRHSKSSDEFDLLDDMGRATLKTEGQETTIV